MTGATANAPVRKPAPPFDTLMLTSRTINEALNLVVSLNQYRRHLSIAELAFAAEKLATLRNGSNQFGPKTRVDLKIYPAIKSKTLSDAALEIGVSHISVKRARTIRMHGTEQDVADVLAGKVALTTKYDQVTTTAQRGKPVKRTRNGGDRVVHFVNAPPIPALTPEQVDPEFKGTPIEFTDKYGHVQIKTAEQYATMRFGDWASAVRAAGKRWSELLPNRPVDHNWLRSPKPYDVTKMREALNFLRPMIAEAEALLARAELVQAPSQPAAGSPPTG